MRLDEPARTHFLNVDFDVDCDHDLADLVAALGKQVLVLNQTEAFVSFELSANCKSLQACLDAFIRMVEGLSPHARKIWDGCRQRTANVGIEAGLQPRSMEFSISNPTVAALAAIGCGIAYTVYAAREFPSASAATSS